jgi:hypothetical protein
MKVSLVAALWAGSAKCALSPATVVRGGRFVAGEADDAWHAWTVTTKWGSPHGGTRAGTGCQCFAATAWPLPCPRV